MPRPPQQAHPDATVTVVARIPGWLKNRVLQQADDGGVSINVWMTNAVLTQLNHGVPAPPPVRPLPELAHQLRAYLSGEQLLGPCGLPIEACDAPQHQIETAAKDAAFCATCGIRCH